MGVANGCVLRRHWMKATAALNCLRLGRNVGGSAKAPGGLRLRYWVEVCVVMHSDDLCYCETFHLLQRFMTVGIGA